MEVSPVVLVHTPTLLLTPWTICIHAQAQPHLQMLVPHVETQAGLLWQNLKAVFIHVTSSDN